MASKGINTVIIESKTAIINAVNDVIKQGVPLSVVKMIFDSVSNELDVALKDVVKREQEEYEAQTKIEAEQVEYTDEPINEEQEAAE